MTKVRDIGESPSIGIEEVMYNLNNLYREWFYILPQKRNIMYWFSQRAQNCDRFFKKYENTLITLASDSSYRIFIWFHSTLRQKIAMIILFDQIPRHIYRGTRFMYDFDNIALNLAKNIPFEKLNEREFVFAILPFEHSESLYNHKLGLRILNKYMENHTETSLLQKTFKQFNAHTIVIQKYGEYPKRRFDYGEKLSEMPEPIRKYIQLSDHKFI
jgi:uncharacterized protein (DUF924 family)